jgi:hypothetical protein
MATHLTVDEFGMLDELTSQGECPSMEFEELHGGDKQLGEVVLVLARRNLVVIEGDIVTVTAAGLRAYGEANKSDVSTIEEAIKFYDLK